MAMSDIAELRPLDADVKCAPKNDVGHQVHSDRMANINYARKTVGSDGQTRFRVMSCKTGGRHQWTYDGKRVTSGRRSSALTFCYWSVRMGHRVCIRWDRGSSFRRAKRKE